MNIKPHTVANKVAETTYVVGHRPNPSELQLNLPGRQADTHV